MSLLPICLLTEVFFVNHVGAERKYFSFPTHVWGQQNGICFISPHSQKRILGLGAGGSCL
jgi:hypothetical protein